MKIQRVAMVCDGYPVLGTKAVEGLVYALSRKGIEVLVISSTKGITDTTLQSTSINKKVEIQRFPSFKVPRVPYIVCPTGPYALKKALTKWKPDIVHLHFIMFSLSLSYAFRKLKNTPMVLTLHGFTLPQEFKQSLYRLMASLIYRTAGVQVVQGASRIVSVSKETQDKFRTIYPRNKVDVIPNGVTQIKSQQQPMVSNPNKLTFVFTGRIDRAKGVQELAEASRILGKKRDDFEVLIVGDGPELGSLISRYGALEHIKFLGYRIDVNDILTESDIFVLPSYREGMSISLMEALSCGVPFLTTDVGGVADVLRNGAKGFVIDKPSVKQLVKSMEQVMNTSKLILSEMGLTNFEVVQNRYSWDCIADQYIALYDSLI